MKRRIKEADGYGAALKSLIESLEVTLLIGHDLIKSSLSLLESICTDHLTESSDPVSLKEHVLGAAKADAFCAKLAGLLSVSRSICIGANLEGSVFISPGHDPAEFACDGSVNGGDDALVDVTGGAVDGDVVALNKGLACKDKLLILFIHSYIGAAGNAAGAHAAGNNGCVRGHTAANGQDAL